jgi:hypothetical protein
MGQVTFADGTSFEYVNAEKGTTYYDGAKRNTLEIQIAEDSADFDTLKEITANSDALEEITLTNGDTTNVYSNYCIRTGLSLEPITVTPATDTEDAVTEDRYCVKLAQLTYDEVQYNEQSDAIDTLGQQIIALTLGGNAQ